MRTFCFLSGWLQVCLLLGLSSCAIAAATSSEEIHKVIDNKFGTHNHIPDYNPPLSVDNFFDVDQIKLSKIARPLESYIRFVEPTDKDALTFASEDQPLKKWTEPEKEDVFRILRHIFAVVPGLVIHAASGEQISFARTSDLTRPEFLRTGTHIDDVLEATAGPMSINLGDLFFENSSQYQALVHELVHEADRGGQIAYSKKWVDFVQPTISKMRIRLNFMPAFQKRELSRSWSRGGGDWVSLYGCENLDEALAEYAAICICDREREIDGKFKQDFLDRLIVPSPRDLAFDRHFRLGESAQHNKRFEEAINQFTKSIAIDPTVVRAHVCLAACLGATGQYDRGLSECQTAEDLFDTTHIPLEDEGRCYFLQQRASIAFGKDDYDLALSTLNKAICNQVLNRSAIRFRNKVEDFSDRPALAALDLYECCNERMLSDFVESGTSDPEYALKLLDADVDRFPNLGVPVARRARFLETLGDAETNSAKKTPLYERALTDFKRTIGKSDCVERRSNYDCGRLCFKLGHPDQIQFYIDKIADDDDTEERPVLQILFLESTGKHAEALVKYRNLKYKLHPADRKDPWNYVTERLRTRCRSRNADDYVVT